MGLCEGCVRVVGIFLGCEVCLGLCTVRVMCCCIRGYIGLSGVGRVDGVVQLCMIV